MQDLPQHVRETLSPWSSSSGTAHVAPLLYNLVRMTRPRMVVEYGSGYTTPFLAQALKDNIDAFQRERGLLLEKSRDFLKTFACEQARARPDLQRQVITDWMETGGEAACLDPCFYAEPYLPQFFSFEALPEQDDYCLRLRALLERLDLADRVTFTYDCFSAGKNGVVPTSMPIDLVWHDSDHFREVFLQLWQQLNPQGGMMLFHLGSRNYDSELDWFRSQRAQAGDLELSTLTEPHKLVQHGCIVLRRRVRSTASVRPKSDLDKFHAMLDALSRLTAEAG
jgi:hypothetical protein